MIPESASPKPLCLCKHAQGRRTRAACKAKVVQAHDQLVSAMVLICAQQQAAGAQGSMGHAPLVAVRHGLQRPPHDGPAATEAAALQPGVLWPWVCLQACWGTQACLYIVSPQPCWWSAIVLLRTEAIASGRQAGYQGAGHCMHSLGKAADHALQRLALGTPARVWCAGSSTSACGSALPGWPSALKGCHPPHPT